VLTACLLLARKKAQSCAFQLRLYELAEGGFCFRIVPMSAKDPPMATTPPICKGEERSREGVGHHRQETDQQVFHGTGFDPARSSFNECRMAETDVGLAGWKQGSYDRAPGRYPLRGSVAELHREEEKKSVA
jgi:hypothetical protein